MPFETVETFTKAKMPPSAKRAAAVKPSTQK